MENKNAQPWIITWTLLLQSGDVYCECDPEDDEETGDHNEVDLMVCMFWYEIEHKGLMSLYRYEVNAAIVRHLCKQKFGQDAMMTANDMCDAYNPLSW